MISSVYISEKTFNIILARVKNYAGNDTKKVNSIICFTYSFIQKLTNALKANNFNATHEAQNLELQESLDQLNVIINTEDIFKDIVKNLTKTQLNLLLSALKHDIIVNKRANFISITTLESLSIAEKDEMRDKILNIVKKKETNRQCLIDFKHDKGLIEGFAIEINSKEFDYSLKSKIKDIKNQITTITNTNNN